MEKILSKIQHLEGFIVPPNGSIIVEHKKENEVGVIVPDQVMAVDELLEVHAINKYSNDVKVGDKVVISLARYIKTKPGASDVGTEYVIAFPEERILEINESTFYIMQESDILYKVEESNTVTVG